MIEHIYTNVEFMDGALKRVIVEALDRAFKNTRGRVPLTFRMTILDTVSNMSMKEFQSLCYD